MYTFRSCDVNFVILKFFKMIKTERYLLKLELLDIQNVVFLS